MSVCRDFYLSLGGRSPVDRRVDGRLRVGLLTTLFITTYAKTGGLSTDQSSASQYQLIHISRNQDVDYTAGVKLRGGHIVQGTTMAINLGITLESKLSWKDHVLKAKSKAIKSLGALSSIAGSTWGGNLLRRIFKAIIIPQITYGASIWHTFVIGSAQCRDADQRPVN